MTRSQRLPRGLLTLVLPLGFGAGPSFAQDDDQPFDRTPDDCLSIMVIDRTHVVDDQTILFYMRNNKVYRNYLPRKCPGLARENRFMYKTHSSRLCSIDTITVIEQWASRLEPGFTCKLGDFHPISPDEIEDLDVRGRDGKKGPGRDPIEATPVELPEPAAEAGAATPADSDDQ